MARLLPHIVTILELLFMLTTLPSILFCMTFDGATYGSNHDAHDSHKLLFNPYNQYTVDQLLIKMPSVLEEPEPSDSEISEKILPPSTKSDLNQNVFKLHLKSLLDSLTFNDTVQLNQTEDATGSVTFDDETTTFQPESQTTDSSLNFDQFSENKNQSKPPSNKIQLEEHRKRQQEVNLIAQSRYKSVKHILSQIHFNCTGREEGYYADPDFDCHIFHYCKENGFKFTFICPANSIFSQEDLQCDSSAMNSKNICRSSENYYFINSLVYKNNSAVLPEALQKNYFDILRNKNKKRKELENGENNVSESISKSVLSSSKWNGIELNSNTKKTVKDSVFYTPKGDFRPLFPTTQMPLIQQIDTPRWFPPVNATSDILNKFNKNGFNVYNREGMLKNASIASTTPQTTITQGTTTTTTSSTTPLTPIKEQENKYSSLMLKVIHEKPSSGKGKGKPPKRTKIPNVKSFKKHISETEMKNSRVKSKPAYSIQWDDDNDVSFNDMKGNNQRIQFPTSGFDDNDRKASSSNVQMTNMRPNNDDNSYLYSNKPMETNFNPLLMDSQDFSPIEFDEIFNKIPLRPLQPSSSGNIINNPEQAYHHMLDHLRQRPPPRVLAALAREQLKPLRMMINNLLVTGPGSSIAKRQFLITPPNQQRPFIPEMEKSKLVKRSDRYLFGPPITSYRAPIRENMSRRRFMTKLRRIWRPIARRLHL